MLSHIKHAVHAHTACLAQRRGRATPRARTDRSATHRVAAAASEAAPADAASPPDASVPLSGLAHLGPDGRANATDPKANPIEKKKNAKSGAVMWTEVYELAALLKSGATTWDALDLDDVDTRLKWVGMFHRRKRTPGKFMMRVRVPNGELTSAQLRALAACIAPYGAEGCADITTRAGVQLRGVTLDDADRVLDLLKSVGLTPLQSGLDNVRQITGSPIAGIDPHELADTRPFAKAVDALITNGGVGNPDLCNLPRKLNVSFSASRDDFVHSHINDVAFEAAVADDGTRGWNVLVGGYLSMKRCATSISFDTFVPDDQIVDFTNAFLIWFREHGARTDRQKARVLWLVERVGIDAAREAVAALMPGKPTLRRAVHVAHGDTWARRDVLGVHDQKQAGMKWVGACVPAGRLVAADLGAMADVADRHGDGSVRLTVDENVVFPNVRDGEVEAALKHDLFTRFPVPVDGALSLTTAMVSCTGAQFCGLALAETKVPMLDVVRRLDRDLVLTRPVRVHVTGCPNSCGQAQAGDIGLIGAPAKKEVDGKKVAVQGFNIITGGTVGEHAQLAATEFEKAVPADEVYDRLKELLVSQFGAVARA